MQGCLPFEAVLKSALKHGDCNESKIRNSIKNVKDKTFGVNRCVLLQCNGAPSCVLKENVRGHSLYPDVWSSGGRQQHHHLALLKTHLLAQHCLSAVIHHKGFELLMEAASASRPLSMIHSLSPSVRRPLLLPSSSSPPLFSGLSHNDGCVKSLTASDGHIQHSKTSQVRSLWCNPPANIQSIIASKSSVVQNETHLQLWRRNTLREGDLWKEMATFWAFTAQLRTEINKSAARRIHHDCAIRCSQYSQW